MAILNCGDKILIAHRRLFEGDSLRFFLGTVTDYEASVMKIEGRSCVQDPATGGVSIKDDLRTKLYTLQSGTILAYNLPASVSIDELEFMGHLGRLSCETKVDSIWTWQSNSRTCPVLLNLGSGACLRRRLE